MNAIHAMTLGFVDSMRDWATVICFLAFTVIALRLWIVGREHYDPVSHVPLSEDRIVEPRGTRVDGSKP